MYKLERKAINKTTLIFLGLLLLISLGLFSASYFFDKDISTLTILYGRFPYVVIPYLIVSLIFWMIQPIATWKKPFVIISTTILGSIVGILLVFSTWFLPGSKNHEYVMYNVCYPALRKYYNVDDLSKMPHSSIDVGRNGSTRWFAQHSECEDNVYKGNGPVFSENPPGF